MKLVLGIFIAICVITTQSSAQIPDLDQSRLNQAAYYKYSDPGDVTIQVHVWGAVRYPGLYEVPRGTRVSELVSLAGGPQYGELNKRSSRIVDIKLLRRSTEGVVIKMEQRMNSEIVTFETDAVLQDDDLLAFESIFRQGFRWADIFPIVSMVGTIVLIVDRITMTS